jgi:hypothetical protein
MNYRAIWKKHFGEIPKDSDGRPYEIHHVNGDRNDNRKENLKCIPIKEHYDIHYNNGDYGACVMIAKRMNLPLDFISQIQKGVKRPGIGGVKKGSIPWNKNIKGYKLHSEKTKKILSNKNSGENNPKSKLTERDVRFIIETYLNKPDVLNVGKVMKNGIQMSYDRSFSIHYSKMYNVSPENIERIIKKKSWKYVWSE